MSPVWLAGVAVMVLVLLPGNGSVSRLRPTAVQRRGVRWRFSGRLSRATTALASLDVPAGLALELRSGRDLAASLAAVADELTDHQDLAARLRAAARSAGSGAPVRPVLGTDALGETLHVTAVCCDLSVSAGLPLADLLDAVADEARGRVVLVGRAKAELAGARSTSVVLACLPLVGLAMGQLLGARPVHVLLATGWGAGCLLAALLLTAAGAVWSRAIRASAERSLP